MTMKRLFLLTSVLLSVLFEVTGQNFQTVYSNRIAFFEGDNHDIKALRIDSVKYDVDSIFYPLKNIDVFDYIYYSPKMPSWIGDKIVICKNGMNLFFNNINDTIKISTNAKLSESWIAYAKDQISITATVSKLDTLSFMGIKDSVKTISFQMYENANPVINDINSKTIRLSKNFGLITTLNFKYFPDIETSTDVEHNYLQELNLVGITNPELGLQNLTWKEVFDFEVGDEYHFFYYSHHFEPLNNSTDSIFTAKKYIYKELKDDSIIYKYERKKYSILIRGQVTTKEFIHDTILLKVVNHPQFDQLPGESFLDGNSLDCYVMQNETLLSKHRLYNGLLTKFSDTTWIFPLYDGCYYGSYYLKGMGSLSYPCIYFDDKIEDDLVYYKKGNLEWGTPIDFDKIVTNKPEIIRKTDLTIYPNPATNSFRISSIKELPLICELVDLSGKVIVKTNIENSEFTYLNKKNLKGVYFYRLISSKGVIKTGKLVLR